MRCQRAQRPSKLGRWLREDDFFFKSMAPVGGEPEGQLGVALKTAFGCLDHFKTLFTLAALEVFGSGWAWLVYDSSTAALTITSTANQDNPIMGGGGSVPLLGLDVWEHAYYLKHQNRRKDYVDAFWNVVSWPEVAARYEEVGACKVGASKVGASKAELVTW